MELSRRGFLKLSGGTMGAAIILPQLGWGKGILDVKASSPISLHKRIGETTTICPYCGVGCGFIAASGDNEIINIEGDPDHPINQGSACSKGSALAQIRTVDGKDNPWRLTKPLYRRAKGTEWEEVSWDWAIDAIGERIKNTRDSNWVEKDGSGKTVNRTDTIACFGGAMNNNEECYLLSKMARSLGIVYLEHCARI